MKWKCLNDIFGYCAGEPDFKQKPTICLGDVYGCSCKLGPKTCGKHQTLTESLVAVAAVRLKEGGAKNAS